MTPRLRRDEVSVRVHYRREAGLQIAWRSQACSAGLRLKGAAEYPESARLEDCTMIFRNALMCAIAIASSFNPTASAFGSEEAERAEQRHAAIGQTVNLGGHVNCTHHCTEVIPTSISVVQGPQHGALEVRDEVVRSVHPELGHGSKCARRQRDGEGRLLYPHRARALTFSPITRYPQMALFMFT